MQFEKTMDKIVAFCKNRGFIFQGSEIYDGLANTWDYGPLGVEFKNNVKKAWWKKFIQENPYNVGVDCAILMNPQVWVASGHVGGFSDPLIDCKQCKTRHRADKLIEDYNSANGIEMAVDGMSNEAMTAYLKGKNIPCPSCSGHNFTEIRKFNLMFKTFQGVTEDSKNEIYLRPETAQGIFVNFMSSAQPAEKFLSGSGKSESLSEMKLHPETLPSEPESLSKWSWSFSVSLEPIWNGSSIGRTSAKSGY